MEIIKKISLCGLAWSILLISCDHRGGLKDNSTKVFINFEKPYISEDLKNISLRFIDTFEINNSIIEVTIEKRKQEHISS